MTDLRIIPSRYAGSCALCLESWKTGTPIAPFPDSSEHVGRWGHPACVAAAAMGLPSTEAAKARIADIRAKLASKEA